MMAPGRYGRLAANSTAGMNAIQIAIASGRQTLMPESALPVITDSVVMTGRLSVNDLVRTPNSGGVKMFRRIYLAATLMMATRVCADFPPSL